MSMSLTRCWYLQLKKGEVLYEWKKDLEESLRRKNLLGKPAHFSVKNTANNAGSTWGFIQKFFQHLRRMANSIVHLMV